MKDLNQIQKTFNKAIFDARVEAVKYAAESELHDRKEKAVFGFKVKMQGIMDGVTEASAQWLLNEGEAKMNEYVDFMSTCRSREELEIAKMPGRIDQWIA